ncbi:MAG TPA: glutamine--fructose-6-phosphate transaminase (isomerizing) [Candidatus Avilachnospira avicola]|nr:glutamine--fructose-6-phosphate transaminase (isomerizing) [Candidatus Avilachnospira avicola]
MCGIVGYTGNQEAAPILLSGLRKLEYRGYDSAGLAVLSPEGEINIVKAKGRLSVLSEKVDEGRALKGTCGIGHTRWATHGEPSEENAHPHYSDDCAVVAVHNGIIENYQELRDKLLRKGYSFHSQTDTEVAVKLVDYYYKKYFGTPVDAINKALVRMRGSYALAIMFKDYPGEIYAAKKDCPLVLGKAESAALLASDVTALLDHTRDIYYLGELQSARLKDGELTFYDLNGDEIEITPVRIEWDAKAAEKGGYEHFMMKEIHEQPAAVRDTLGSLIRDGRIDISVSGLSDEELKGVRQVCIIGCGSAYHIGACVQYVIEDLARIPVRVEFASEFRYRKPLLSDDTLYVIISQSGETADSLAALRLIRAEGHKALSIVNVVGSSIARESDHVIYTHAGPEIAVATTKAYSAQLSACYALAIKLGIVNGQINEDREGFLVSELLAIPEKINEILKDDSSLQWIASQYANARDIFVIGRGIDYAISMEASLKIKEVSYIHSEAYAAGELKHGTISLIEKGTLAIGILTQPQVYEKTLSNMVECKSRGAYLLGVGNGSNKEMNATVDLSVNIPDTDPHFAASLAIIPMQLLGYYLSVSKGLDVDKPRNLAKSVTVE